MEKYFILSALMAAIAMPLWMAHCKRHQYKHYLLHWLAALLPVGLFFIVNAIDYDLVKNVFVQWLIVLPATVGGAAFLGGLVVMVFQIITQFLKVLNLNVTVNKRWQENNYTPYNSDHYKNNFHRYNSGHHSDFH